MIYLCKSYSVMSKKLTLVEESRTMCDWCNFI